MHCMIDIETLGTKPGSIILSLGAAKFDEAGVVDSNEWNIDPIDCERWGLTADASTVMWWLKQSEAARSAVTTKQRPLKEVLQDFNEYYNAEPKCNRIWAFPATFDIVLLEIAYNRVKVKPAWSYRQTRDARTLSECSGFSDKSGSEIKAIIHGAQEALVEHKAGDDAIEQARLVVYCLDLLRKEKNGT